MRRDAGSLIRYLRRLTPPAECDSDGLLLERFAAGDESAFSALLRRHGALVWGVCLRTLPMAHDAEDAFQAVFVVLARKAGGLRRAELLAPWLHRVAWRTAQKARARRSLCGPVEERSTAMDPATRMLSRELRGLIDEEIDRLPERYRRPVLLCLVEGLTNEEAASRLGCPVGTVQSRLSRARDRLRRALMRRGVEGPAALGALAAPAVPARLLESSLSSITSSATVTALAKGVLLAMTLKRFEIVLVLLVFTLAGSGAWFGSRPGGTPAAVAEAVKPEGREKGKVQDPPKPAEPPQAEQEKPPVVKRADTLTLISKALDTRIMYPGIDGPETTLGEELERLQKVYGLQFTVNERAFAEEDVESVLDTKIGRIAPMRTSLDRALRKVLSRIPKTKAIYLVRNDCLEITTTKAVLAELGPVPTDPLTGRPFNPLDDERTEQQESVMPLMSVNFVEADLKDVLKKFAASSGYNVILDPRAQKEKAPKREITVQFLNVPVDVAVALVAEMSSLTVVRRANVFFVTTEQVAMKMRKEEERTNPSDPMKRIPPGIAGTPPGPPAK